MVTIHFRCVVCGWDTIDTRPNELKVEATKFRWCGLCKNWNRYIMIARGDIGA